MFSLRDLRFVLCSRDLNVLRAQRIMGFVFQLPTNQRGRKIRSRAFSLKLKMFYLDDLYRMTVVQLPVSPEVGFSCLTTTPGLLARLHSQTTCGEFQIFPTPTPTCSARSAPSVLPYYTLLRAVQDL